MGEHKSRSWGACLKALWPWGQPLQAAPVSCVSVYQGADEMKLPELNSPAALPKGDQQAASSVSERLNAYLKDTGLAGVIGHAAGPVIITCGVKLAPNVKLSSFERLLPDICSALDLDRAKVRVIPHSAQVLSIEIPAPRRSVLPFGSLTEVQDFANSAEPLPLILGCDTVGRPLISCLTSAGNILAAGDSAAETDNLLQQILLSLLLKCSPEQLRLVLIDGPRGVFSPYSRLPHLLCPVVNALSDPQGALAALRLLHEEGARRSALFTALGLRRFNDCSLRIRDAAAAGAPLSDPLWQPDPKNPNKRLRAPDLKPLPYIVLMSADGLFLQQPQAAELLTPYAAAPSLGFYTVLALQQGNGQPLPEQLLSYMPSRLLMRTHDAQWSAQLAGAYGAEQLLGEGDMLCRGCGFNSRQLFRAHSAMVMAAEVQQISHAWYSQGDLQMLADLKPEPPAAPAAPDNAPHQSARAQTVPMMPEQQAAQERDEENSAQVQPHVPVQAASVDPAVPEQSVNPVPEQSAFPQGAPEDAAVQQQGAPAAPCQDPLMKLAAKVAEQYLADNKVPMPVEELKRRLAIGYPRAEKIYAALTAQTASRTSTKPAPSEIKPEKSLDAGKNAH